MTDEQFEGFEPLDDIELLRKLRHDADLDRSVLAEQRRRLMAAIEEQGVGAIPDGVQRIIPHLIYEDVAGAIDWLTRAFGFVERSEGRMLESDGTIGHAEMQVGDALIMLGPPSVHGDSPARGVSTMLSVCVGDVDRHCERAQAAGATIVLEPENQPWGDRRYQARDPAGHMWHFTQSLR